MRSFTTMFKGSLARAEVTVFTVSRKCTANRPSGHTQPSRTIMSSSRHTRTIMSSSRLSRPAVSSQARVARFPSLFMEPTKRINLSQTASLNLFSHNPEVEPLREEAQQKLTGLGSPETWKHDEFARENWLSVQRIQDPSLRSEKTMLHFVCVHNAGRSQMAQAWARHYGGSNVIAVSSGSGPRNQVNPQAVEAMKEVGVDMSDAFPKPLTDRVVQASTLSITMGCGDACPKFAGVTYADWKCKDPHGEGLQVVREVREDIRERVLELFEQLQIPTVQ